MAKLLIASGISLLLLGIAGAVSVQPISVKPVKGVAKVTGTEEDTVSLVISNPTLQSAEVVGGGCGCGTKFSYPKGTVVTAFGSLPVKASIRGATLSHGEHKSDVTLMVKSGGREYPIHCKITILVDRSEK